MRLILPLPIHAPKDMDYSSALSVLMKIRSHILWCVWRLALIVICTKHRVPLMNECVRCGASINFHLTPRNLYELKRKFSITQCFNCFSDLRDSVVEQPQVPIEA